MPSETVHTPLLVTLAWRYILREKLDVVPLYLAAERPTVERNGQILVRDDDRMPLLPGERVVSRMVTSCPCPAYIASVPPAKRVSSSGWADITKIDAISNPQAP